ncbi:uncharacterized protein LOC115878111 [Sitophilus oryzae]|uniref:Uncharacterized protein LOC115878111 n=1 Tax=Sitophilus oryzae TaxID=7048 RepID=A0A6J2XG52_SITOR|nr:uncharacterized protein LOC115878111 [Sitophilus oryzae]
MAKRLQIFLQISLLVVLASSAVIKPEKNTNETEDFVLKQEPLKKSKIYYAQKLKKYNEESKQKVITEAPLLSTSTSQSTNVPSNIENEITSEENIDNSTANFSHSTTTENITETTTPSDVSSSNDVSFFKLFLDILNIKLNMTRNLVERVRDNILDHVHHYVTAVQSKIDEHYRERLEKQDMMRRKPINSTEINN